MKPITKLVSILLLALLPACATSSASGGNSGLMGLDDEPATAVWEDWTAEPAQGLVPQAFVDDVVAFDYWQIGDDAFVSQGWTGVSALLDYVRREGLAEAQDNTVTLLLQALDSRQPPDKTMMDVTYVVSLDQNLQPTEGLVVRVYAPLTDRGVTPGAAIYLSRIAGSGAGFDQAILWAVPAFEQARAFTLTIEKTDAGWSAHRVGAAVYPADEAALQATKTRSLDGANELIREIFSTRFWDPLTRVGFVEAKEAATEEMALPTGIEPALGLEVRERQLEEIYADTVFPPRVEAPKMDHSGF
jgi:hypothetical protein